MVPNHQLYKWYQIAQSTSYVFTVNIQHIKTSSLFDLFKFRFKILSVDLEQFTLEWFPLPTSGKYFGKKSEQNFYLSIFHLQIFEIRIAVVYSWNAFSNFLGDLTYLLIMMFPLFTKLYKLKKNNNRISNLP